MVHIGIWTGNVCIFWYPDLLGEDLLNGIALPIRALCTNLEKDNCVDVYYFLYIYCFYIS